MLYRRTVEFWFLTLITAFWYRVAETLILTGRCVRFRTTLYKTVGLTFLEPYVLRCISFTVQTLHINLTTAVWYYSNKVLEYYLFSSGDSYSYFVYTWLLCKLVLSSSSNALFTPLLVHLLQDIITYLTNAFKEKRGKTDIALRKSTLAYLNKTRVKKI